MKKLMPHPFKQTDREEKLEQALLKLWIMLDESVADAISAHLDEVLTELHIEHNVRITLGGNKKNEMG